MKAAILFFLFAQVNPILGPTGGRPGDIILLDASRAEAKAYSWQCIPMLVDEAGKPITTIVPLNDKCIVASRPGTRTVMLSVVEKNSTADRPILTTYLWTVTITGGPDPPTPTPPGPQPPPIPTPPVPPNPVVPTGFRVLVIYETGDGLSKDRANAVFSKEVRDYLNAKCVKDSRGQPEWRILDDDVVFADSESKTIRDLFKDAKPTLQALPAVVIASDGKFVAMPLPESKEAMLTLLKSKGG